MYRVATLAFLAVCLLAGCSTTGLVYDNLPWLLRNRIDARFDLTSTQSGLLKTQLADFAEWHRREELPHYAAALQRLERDLGDGLTDAELEQFRALFMQARRRLVSRAIPLSVDFLYTVSEEQIAEFEQTHREDIEEDSERLKLTPAEQAEVRYERTIDNLEDWFGAFDAAQREHIREFPIVSLRPDVIAGKTVDELRGDANPTSNPAHAAFYHVAHAQLVRYLLNVHRFALLGECGIACDDEQPANARECFGGATASASAARPSLEPT